MTLKLGPISPIVTLLAALWIIHLINALSGGLLMPLGIEPRTLRGLDGVLAAPLLHGSFSHLLSNTAGLGILGILICIQDRSTFWRVTVFITIVAGLATWWLARSGLHVGASSLVFGYFGYLLMRGFVERTPASIIMAVLVAATYGGLLYGVLPNQRGISWEGHLFGFLAGALAARWRIHLDMSAKR